MEAESILLYLNTNFHKAKVDTGLLIPPNVFGAGLFLSHAMPIVVNPLARIGENCAVHPFVVIASYPGRKVAPKIGNNVFIGSGAKLYGDISLIADASAIGANSVVNKSFDELKYNYCRSSS